MTDEKLEGESPHGSASWVLWGWLRENPRRFAAALAWSIVATAGAIGPVVFVATEANILSKPLDVQVAYVVISMVWGLFIIEQMEKI